MEEKAALVIPVCATGWYSEPMSPLCFQQANSLSANANSVLAESIGPNQAKRAGLGKQRPPVVKELLSSSVLV